MDVALATKPAAASNPGAKKEASAVGRAIIDPAALAVIPETKEDEQLSFVQATIPDRIWYYIYLSSNAINNQTYKKRIKTTKQNSPKVEEDLRTSRSAALAAAGFIEGDDHGLDNWRGEGNAVP